MNRPGISSILSVTLGLVIAMAALLALTFFDTGGNGADSAGNLIAVGDDAPASAVTAPAAAETAPAEVEPEPAPAEPALKIVVSTRRLMLFLVEGRDTLMRAPVAIGMNEDFEYNGRKWRFETPRGTRRIIGKSPDPVWVPPDWHYFEKAHKKGLEAARLEWGDTIPLEDGSFLVAADSAIGRINQFGHFAEFSRGVEIIFDGRIYIPPINSRHRRVPDALGPYKLDMGDGYLIHGTHYYNEESIGEAVSHGCVRMNNNDIIRLYPMVPRGTVVEII